MVSSSALSRPPSTACSELVAPVLISEIVLNSPLLSPLSACFREVRVAVPAYPSPQASPLHSCATARIAVAVPSLASLNSSATPNLHEFGLSSMLLTSKPSLSVTHPVSVELPIRGVTLEPR
jgi:hypothetical protein